MVSGTQSHSAQKNQNKKVGLLGGTFDPPHEGHVHASEVAIRRLGLDKIQWLVTPKNPLKESPSPLAERLKKCEAITEHNKKIECTDAEATFGSTYTIDTITKIIQKNPKKNFVWVMGADNLGQFRQWKQWEDIIKKIPIAVISRPGYEITKNILAPILKEAKAIIPEQKSTELPMMNPPAITIINEPGCGTSSTEIRNKTQKQK